MIARDLLQLLACPDCHGALDGIDDMTRSELRCASCGASYPVRDGIPILLPPDLDTAHLHDEIGHAHKHGQANHYDRAVAEEFEITRPHGAPVAYTWLLREKFRRSTERLPSLRDATVVDACCGSGMDAEMLARAGARVIALDISEGCVRRARARAERFGLDYVAVVGDVEHLPLRDRAVDISYVHDGLHHLESPATGLRELARVARRAVSINEPADAFGTAVAVRLGLALAREDAGNAVARLRPVDAQRELAAAGFDATARRYFMYYKHDPGAAMRLASRPGVHRAYRTAVHASDALLGRWGNKLQITALRRAA
jgi:SAM-dependent methyltransferase